MEPVLSYSLFQSAHAFCHTQTLPNILLNLKEIQCEKFKSLTQLSSNRFIVAVIGKQIVAKQQELIKKEIFQPQDREQMDDLNEQNVIHGEMQEQNYQNNDEDQYQNQQHNMRQDQYGPFRLILYYIDEKSTIINHLSYDQNQKVQIFPYSAKQAILVFRSKVYSYNQSPEGMAIKLIKFVDFQTLKQINVLDNSHNMYRSLQCSEQIISFPNSRTFCFIQPEGKDNINIKYYETQTKFNNQQPVYSTRLEQKPGEKFVKGNNSSMIIWYTEIVSRYVKFIEFHYFSLEKKDKKPSLLKFQKTQEMFRCQLIEIYKIIEVGFYKFLIIFIIDKKIRIFFYEAVKKLLRQSLIQIQPSYSIQRADFVFPHLVRLVVEYTPQKIFEPVIPLFEQNIPLITRPKGINNNNSLKIKNKPDYRIYYLDTAFEKIAVVQKLKIFSECFHQYDINYFNQCFYMEEQQQIVIKEHKICQNGPLAFTFLILEYLGEGTDDNFIIQTLELLGL